VVFCSRSAGSTKFDVGDDYFGLATDKNDAF